MGKKGGANREIAKYCGDQNVHQPNPGFGELNSGYSVATRLAIPKSRKAMIPGLRSGSAAYKGFAMLIGVPKEIKSHEYRVGLVPGSVRELVHHGHKVVVESGAGAAIGFDYRAYEASGAGILARSADVFAVAEVIVKVKEPQPDEVRALREDQLLFTYLHLAADLAQAEGL